jgi:hypothetical protein
MCQNMSKWCIWVFPLTGQLLQCSAMTWSCFGTCLVLFFWRNSHLLAEVGKKTPWQVCKGCERKQHFLVFRCCHGSKCSIQYMTDCIRHHRAFVYSNSMAWYRIGLTAPETRRGSKGRGTPTLVNVTWLFFWKVHHQESKTRWRFQPRWQINSRSQIGQMRSSR